MSGTAPKIGQIEVLRLRGKRTNGNRYKPSDGWRVFFAEYIKGDLKGQEIQVEGKGIWEDPFNRAMAVTGVWEQSNYGVRFRAFSVLMDLKGKTKSQAIDHILSMEIPLVTKPVVEKLVTKYREYSELVLRLNPEKLAEDIEGVDQETVNAIKLALPNVNVTQLRNELIKYEVDLKHLQDIIHNFKDPISTLKNAPYSFDMLHDFGFKKCDELAKNIGFPADDIDRVSKAVERAFKAEVASKGACATTPGSLMAMVSRQMNESALGLLDDNVLIERIADLIDRGDLVAIKQDEDTLLYLRRTYKAEKAIGSFFSDPNQSTPWLKFDASVSIDIHARETGFHLAKGQREAVETICKNRVSILTGGPGTGKTTTLRTALDILESQGVSIRLMAPTGVAAKRMREATSKESSTLHSGIRDEDGQTFGPDNPFPESLVVIDETTMADIEIMDQTLSAISAHTAVLFCGDRDQLPSVGIGRVFADLIDAGTIPVSKLTEIHRQGKDSAIITATQKINSGEMPVSSGDKPEDDFRILSPGNSPNDIVKGILNEVCNVSAGLGYDPLRDVMVLTPITSSKTNPCTVPSLNLLLQEKLNPPERSKPELVLVAGKDNEDKTGRKVFRTGDKVIYTRNDKALDLVNGDVGIITRAHPGRMVLEVDFFGERRVLKRDDMDKLELAYAMTIHKSQGSEAPRVVMAVPETGSFLQRNVIYTGATRAKASLVMIGSKNVIKAAIGRTDNLDRHTLLASWVAGKSPEIITANAFRSEHFEAEKTVQTDIMAAAEFLNESPFGR